MMIDFTDEVVSEIGENEYQRDSKLKTESESATEIVRSEIVDTETFPTPKTFENNDTVENLNIHSETSNVVTSEVVVAPNEEISIDSESLSSLKNFTNNDFLSMLQNSSINEILSAINDDGDLKLASETLPISDRVIQEVGKFKKSKKSKKTFIPAKFSRPRDPKDNSGSKEDILTRPKKTGKVETLKKSKNHISPPIIKDHKNKFQTRMNKLFNMNNNLKNDFQTEKMVFSGKKPESRLDEISGNKNSMTLDDLAENAKPKNPKMFEPKNPTKVQGNIENIGNIIPETGKIVSCWL